MFHVEQSLTQHTKEIIKMTDFYNRFYHQSQKRHSPLLKPILTILFIGAMLIAAVFCTGFNFDILDTNYTFDVAITRMPDGAQKEIPIRRWKDYEGEQIQILATDGTIYLLSMNNTVLIKNPRKR
jgi:hypothetical protein